MRNLVLSVWLLTISVHPLYAAQSVILNSDGYACMGDDKSRKATEKAAMQDARNNAGQAALVYIKTETHVKNGELQKDLVSAYANAKVKLLQELMSEWFKDPVSGQCYRVKLKFEVLPDDQTLADKMKRNREELLADSQAPLAVKVWTSRKKYRTGEKVEVFIKGNRPFYGKVVYQDAGGNLIQLLPNPYRMENYFNGGTVYALPSGNDRFILEISPPYGNEKIALYASSFPLGELQVSSNGGVYSISDKADEVPIRARGINIVPANRNTTSSSMPTAAEFAEDSWQLTTYDK